MGRHGGGSRGGGRSGGGRSRGGSRGSGTRTSSRPFRGSVDRSYYDRRGRYHVCHTNDRSFGKKRGGGVIAPLIFITFHMIFMLWGFCAESGGLIVGTKVSGNRQRIFIEDRQELLNNQEEAEIIELFEDVYEKTGMPVTLYTDDLLWRQRYDSLEVYSEELYYSIGIEEDAMIILFTQDNVNGFDDWDYDMYCGDDTLKCFPDREFDKLLDNFHNGMARQDLTQALKYAWGSIMDDLGKKRLNLPLGEILPILAFYSIFYIVLIADLKKRNDAYRYFKENPQELERGTYPPVSNVINTGVSYLTDCPCCGAPNDKQLRNCEYCGRLMVNNDLSSNMRC
ncbi:MAG: TPM domain-containing protein [Oscillospiraceae bacterium]|nr:TPM domain-containing protein [Oscillospiraceae bacterium]